MTSEAAGADATVPTIRSLPVVNLVKEGEPSETDGLVKKRKNELAAPDETDTVPEAKRKNTDGPSREPVQALPAFLSDPQSVLRGMEWPADLNAWKACQDVVFKGHTTLPQGWVRCWSRSQNKVFYASTTDVMTTTFTLDEVYEPGTHICNAAGADESVCAGPTTGIDAGVSASGGAKGIDTSLASVISKLLQADVDDDDIKNSDLDKARWENELRAFYATPLSALFDEEIARINRAIGDEFKAMTPKGKAQQPHVRWNGVVFLQQAAPSAARQRALSGARARPEPSHNS